MTPVVILAGGEGRRMGGRKPERLLAGRPLIAHAVDQARKWGDPVAVALRSEGQWPNPEPDVRLIQDDPALEGPLAGLAAALEWALSLGRDRVLVAACDTPFLPNDLARRLEEELRPDAGAALAATPGRLHPACALWRVESLAAVRSEAAAGRGSLRGVAARAAATIVEWPAQAADAFANINTPQDLLLAQARLEEISSC
ncbi:molybdenum cofactor guanylyltransferase [Brevundimonas diminuta]|jgi:molybdopterin-guanine dinucleotide biosynthesis protein A